MIMREFDVIIVGASFSGLTLAHHIPRDLRVLVIDSKPSPGLSVESTGLITRHTRNEFASFFPIDRFITNSITSICVIAPSFQDYFISKTDHAWIFQTDTRPLVRHLGDTLPSNITVQSASTFLRVDDPENVEIVEILTSGIKEKVKTRFLVGADGGRSRVASEIPGLDRNERFLVGYEQVFFGKVNLGPIPEETIYHFWFGEFSLGYGGWLSPTIAEGRPAFRIGLAKLKGDQKEAPALLRKFIRILLENGTIEIDGDPEKPYYMFGTMIPIGGPLKRIHQRNVLLIGDAAGFCGAFAADGIKGSVISGKEAGPLIARYLKGEKDVLFQFHSRIDSHNHLMEYYRRQIRYRWIWDLMKRNRTFRAMYKIIASERASFLDQFCDSKDKRKSLSRVVLKFRHIPKLFLYTWHIILDFLFSLPKREGEMKKSSAIPAEEN